MPGLQDRNQDNSAWGATDQVPDRFQKVAAGEEGAGPVSVSALHAASHGADGHHSHRHDHGHSAQKGNQMDNSKSSEKGVQQRFGEETGQSLPAELPEREDVLEAMRDVIDPELGINIVDLGLVYGVEISPNGLVVLEMTLTSAACPLTDMIEDQTRMVLAPLASDVHIEWVWMPPWGPDRITPEGREQLRALGFNV